MEGGLGGLDGCGGGEWVLLVVGRGGGGVVDLGGFEGRLALEGELAGLLSEV